MNKELPENLRPYSFHRLDITPNGDQGVADCPFCDAKNKFFVSQETGQFDCKRCGQSGNTYSFLKQVHDAVKSTSNIQDLKRIRKYRKNVPSTSVLKRAGICLDSNGQVLIPHKKPGVKSLTNLRRWDRSSKVAYNTPGLCSMFFLLWNEEGPVFVCEGEWDALALQTLLEKAKFDDPISIIAVPGANITKVFNAKFLKGRDVFLAYDYEKDKKRRGSKKKFNPGRDGMEAATKVLSEYTASVNTIDWQSLVGELKTDKYDISDYVADALASKKSRLWTRRLLAAFTSSSSRKGVGEKKVKALTRTSFGEVVNDFETRLEFNQTFKDTLACCFASLITLFMNHQKRNPLWMFVVAPASSGKTTIIESFDAATEYTIQLSRLTPASLVTGLKFGDDDYDPSLLSRLRDCVLFIKDFTPVLSMNSDKEQIFGILRDAYDGSYVAHYATCTREYKDLYFGVVAGVTYAIEQVNMSDLGERFLRIRLIDDSFDELSHIEKALANLDEDTGDNGNTRELLQGSVLGYIQHMMKNMYQPTYDSKGNRKLAALARIAALCRTTVPRGGASRDIHYRPTAEIASRIATQLKKLGLGLALVYGQKTVDDECFRVMQRVALDSCTGWKLEVAQILVKNPEGMNINTIADHMQVHRNQVIKIVEDCMQIRLVHRAEKRKGVGNRGSRSVIYNLTDEARELFVQAGLAERTVKTRRSTFKKGKRRWRR